ncbi:MULTISPECIES: hypothetical protein [unclassified Acidovorax]|uniref:hypothetical protein n=1 Tax=unclassified Acidovorax TaxID=2684926 RepID=UPI001041D7D7|nr:MULTISPECIES: hypothetical protein [unclassified Acidovorax]
MKSPEVYALLKSELAPWFKSAGFKRANGPLSWYRECGSAYVVAWFQISQDGWDFHSGSKFVVEFQKSTKPIVGANPSRRKRLAKFLSAGEREEIRLIQNRVISDLPPPPQDHPTFQISPDVAKWYIEKFREVSAPYRENEDIWLRYHSSQHVSSWASFIGPKLPECVSIAESWSSEFFS